MRRGLLLPAALAVACGACGGGVKTRSLAVTVAPEANASSPVPVELVVVYDEALLEAIGALPARDWFARREQLLGDNPVALKSVLWEFVPGQVVPDRRVPIPPDRVPFVGAEPKGALLFVGYRGEGEHRARVDPYARFVLHLGETEFTIEPVR